MDGSPFPGLLPVSWRISVHLLCTVSEVSMGWEEMADKVPSRCFGVLSCKKLFDLIRHEECKHSS